MKQKLSTLFFMAFFPLAMMAYDCLWNGIYYNLDDNTMTAEVTYGEQQYSSYYSGNVVIPNTISYGNGYLVTGIGECAFYGCSGLTSITIPNSVTSIGQSAFVNCSNLTSITIPNSVTSIGNYAFQVCSNLTSVTIPNSVTRIGNNLFGGCTALANISVASGNSKYDSRNNCNAIIETSSNTLLAGCKNTIIPNSVTSIGQSSFYDCSGLASITIPNSVTSIGAWAFNGCSGLTSINIPNSVTSIGTWAFQDCSGLTSITIPNSVTSIEDGAFNGCSALANISVASGNSKYDSRNNCNAIIETSSNTLLAGCKNTIIPNSVTNLGRMAFSRCSGLTSVTIPNSVTSIGDYAFFDCPGLTSITIPNSVTSIENNVFSGCSSLTSVTIPNSVTNIKWLAFSDCSSLTSITIPNSVTSIGDEAFYGCSSLASVTAEWDLPLSVPSNIFNNVPLQNATLYVPTGTVNSYNAANVWKDFGRKAENANIQFADAKVKSLCVAKWDTNGDGELNIAEAEAVTVLGGEFRENEEITSFDELRYFTRLTSIGYGAFRGCSGLTSIIIPYSVTRIREYAFENCSALTSIDIPNSVTSINNLAFYNCSSLTSIFIPTSVTSIGDYAFPGCSSVANISVASGNSKYDSRNNCNAIIETSSNKLMVGCKNTIIPNSVTSIGNYAFYDCSGLTSIDIPNSVTSIGNYSFYGCSGLTSIDIPNSVTSIGDYAFQNCSALASVIVEWDIPLSVPSHLFKEVPLQDVTLYVPVGTKAAYQAADVWKDFGNIVENANIDFADASVRAICVANWDINGDGELNMLEAASVKDIGREFSNHEEITSFNELKYFTGLTDLNSLSFYRCSNLTSITIPNSVTGIGSSAFGGCSSLTSVYVGWDEPISVNSNAFSSVPLAQATLYVPAGTKEAYQVADVWKDFGNIVENIIIDFADANVKAICVENWDINHDGELSMAEAAAVTDLGTVFKGNEEITSFEELQYFTGLTSIGAGAFDNCHSLISVTIPRTVTSLESCAFCGTWGLQSLVIPDGVTSIEELAVAWQFSLFSIAIPSSVTNIVSNAFASGCLTSVTVAWENPLAVPENTFKDTPIEYATLYVPAGTKDAYQAADVWKDFGNIVEYVDLVENGKMEENPSEDWTSFWVNEWRTMEEKFEGPANIVEDPKDAGNHSVKVVVRSQAEAMEAGNMSDDGEGNFADWDSQFFIQSKVKIESGKKLRLIMRVRADKAASIRTEAHQTPGDYNHWELFGGIDVTPNWKWVEREVVITPDMTQENNGKEMRTVAFDLATIPDGNVFYFDDIKLEVMDNVQDITILPWGVDQPWEAKYVNDDSNATEDTNGNPWYAVNYDDTSWNTLTGPIERSNSQWFSQSFFDWEPECSPIYMRRTFALNAIPNGNIIIKAIVDDNMQVYLNGEKIPCISLEDFEKVYLVPQSALRVGDNVLALLATDEGGGEARCDYGMFVTDNLSYYIDEQGVVYYFEPIGEGAQRCVVYGLTMDHNTDIVIADEVLGTPVTCIRTDAFFESDIAAVTIPASVTEIGEMAFFGCRALSSITVEWDTPLAVPENVFDDRTYDEATLHTPGDHENYYTADVWKYFMWNGYYAHRLLLELIERMEGAGDDQVYELDEAKALADDFLATEEGLEVCIAQLQQQIQERCADAEENDYSWDVTGLITNPSFSFNNNLYWKGDTPLFQTWDNAEFFGTTFDIHQELTGLPNGRYLLKVKGFHRPGTNEDVYNDYQQGINNASAQLYANGESVTLNNQAAFAQDEMVDWCGIDVSHDGVTQYVPNNMHDAYMWFSKGYYENELPVNITDGNLTLGIRLDESVDWGWVIFDDFRLEYLGALNDHLYADVTEEYMDIFQGKTANVNLNLDNEETILALEFSMSLPEGISIAKTKKGEWDVTLNSERSNGHQLTVTDNGNGVYHFVCHEGSANALKGNIGELMSIRLICDKETETGSCQATISNIQFTDINRNTIYDKNKTFDINVSYLLDGDVNGDNIVNVTDLILMIDYIMERDMGNVNFNLYAADHNNDGKIRVIDVVEQVNLIFEFMNNNTSANSFDSFSSGLSLVNGKDGAVHVSLSDDAQYIASQFIVTLSDGQVLSDVKADNGHDVRIEQLSDNRYFVICYSMDNAAFRTKDQTLTLRVEGRGDVAVEEPAFVDTNKNLVLFQDAHTETTGIDTTLGDPTSPTDIYSINGQVVRKNATTTDGLNRGVYIVNGKKHSKK